MRLKHRIAAACVLLVTACGSNPDDPRGLDYADVDTNAKEEGFKGDPDFYAANAASYYERGDYLAALTQFRKLLDIDPQSVPGRLGEAFCLYRLGIQHGAVGNMREAAAKLDKAKDAFAALAKELPIESSATEGDGFGWKSRLGLGMTERGIAALSKQQIDRIDAALPGIQDPKERNDAFTAISELKLKRAQENRLSIAHYEELVAMPDCAPDAVRDLADLYLIGEESTRAERLYLQYLEFARKSVATWEERRKLAPDYIQSKNELALTLSQIETKRKAATEKTVDVLSRLAEIKFRAENWTDCLALLKEAAELAPENETLNVPIAECYDRLGETRKALEHIEAYLVSTSGYDDNARKASKLRANLIEKLRAESAEPGK